MNLAWGGYQNGLIPQNVLVAVGKDSFGRVQYLEASAARAYFALDAAFFRQFHKHLVVNYGDRTLEAQKEMYAAYLAHPATNPYAAYPGTSNHGWARAADFGSNTQYAGTPEANWLKVHGPEYGFWPTGYGFAKVEPWHYDFRPGTATASLELGENIMALDNDDKAFLNNLGQAIIEQIRGEGTYDYSARPSTIKRVLEDVGFIHDGSDDSLKAIHAAVLAVTPSVAGEADLTPILDAIRALPDATVTALKNAL